MKKLNKKIGTRPVVLIRLFDEQGDVPTEIHVLPVGEWDHPAYGKIIINQEDINEFVEHFDAEIRKDLPITEGHESLDEKPAIGWFKELVNRGAQGLYAVVEWTERGKELLRSKAYKYFSPEFHEVYEDPETREKYTNVLVGGALTNKPYFKELEPVVFTEPDISSDNQKKMNLEEILAKDPGTLSDEEKAFLKDHKDELTEEQKTSLENVLKEEDSADTPPADNPSADNPSADTPPADNPPADAAKASEKVQISASEYAALKRNADAGYAAAQKLEAKEIADQVAELTFSEGNRGGKFLPKSKDKLTDFVKSLNEKQRKSFAEVVAELPEAKLFSEIGDGDEPEDGGVEKKVDNAVKKFMSEHEGVSYSDALKQVFAENPQLEKEYEKAYPTS